MGGPSEIGDAFEQLGGGQVVRVAECGESVADALPGLVELALFRDR